MAINKNLRKQKASVYICGLYSFQFVITGILGFACARRKTTYLVSILYYNYLLLYTVKLRVNYYAGLEGLLLMSSETNVVKRFLH